METITYTALAKLVHPDLNPNDPSATDKMKQLNGVKNNPHAVNQLAIKWGIIKGTVYNTNNTYTNNSNFYNRSYDKTYKTNNATVTIRVEDYLFAAIKFKVKDVHYSGIIFSYKLNWPDTSIEFCIFTNNEKIFKITTRDGKNIKIIGRIDRDLQRIVRYKIQDTHAYMRMIFGVEPNKNYESEDIHIRIHNEYKFHKVIRTTATMVVFKDNTPKGERRALITKIVEFTK